MTACGVHRRKTSESPMLLADTTREWRKVECGTCRRTEIFISRKCSDELAT